MNSRLKPPFCLKDIWQKIFYSAKCELKDFEWFISIEDQYNVLSFDVSTNNKDGGNYSDVCCFLFGQIGCWPFKERSRQSLYSFIYNGKGKSNLFEKDQHNRDREFVTALLKAEKCDIKCTSESYSRYVEYSNDNTKRDLKIQQEIRLNLVKSTVDFLRSTSVKELSGIDVDESNVFNIIATLVYLAVLECAEVYSGENVSSLKNNISSFIQENVNNTRIKRSDVMKPLEDWIEVVEGLKKLCKRYKSITAQVDYYKKRINCNKSKNNLADIEIPNEMKDQHISDEDKIPIIEKFLSSSIEIDIIIAKDKKIVDDLEEKGQEVLFSISRENAKKSDIEIQIKKYIFAKLLLKCYLQKLNKSDLLDYWKTDIGV